MCEESKTNEILERLLTEPEVAEALGVCRATLQRHRLILKTPLLPYLKIGVQIRYRRADVDAALAAMVDDGSRVERRAAADEVSLAAASPAVS